MSAKDLNKGDDILSNPIEEFFARNESNKEVLASRELFKVDEENVDLKTEIDAKELPLINRVIFNNEYLKSKGLKPVYDSFIYKYLRLKVSLKRQGRTEYAKVISSDKSEDILGKMSNIQNIKDGTKNPR